MNCQEVREIASDYLDQRLAPPQTLSLEEHLGGCSGCREAVEALRATVSLIGSLEEIETTPDFLPAVNRKIDRAGKMERLRAWIAGPINIKVSLEITGLLFVSITAFYLYQKSPELPGEKHRPAPAKGLPAPQDKPREEAFQQGGQGQERQPMARVEPEGPAAVAVLPSRRDARELARRTGEPAAAAARRSEVLEIEAGDPALHAERVRALLRELGGRVVGEARDAESGLSLTVELPGSREADFVAALIKETPTESEVAQSKEKAATLSRERARGAELGGPLKREIEPSPEAQMRKRDPAVTLNLRIRPKK